MSCLRTCCFAIAALKQNPALFLQNRNEHLNKIKQSYTCTHASNHYAPHHVVPHTLLVKQIPKFLSLQFHFAAFFSFTFSGYMKLRSGFVYEHSRSLLFVPIPLRTTSRNVFHFLCVFFCYLVRKKSSGKVRKRGREREGAAKMSC